MKNSFLIKKLFLGAFVFSAIFASSCQTISEQEEAKIKILLPSGAPTLPSYSFIENNLADVVSDPTIIPAEFSKGEYPFIVFDSTKAQKILDNQGENAKYEFVKMLTGGNFYLVGFNKSNEDVQKDDIVYGFMETSTPGMLFKSIYDAKSKFDYNANSIADLATMLTTIDSNYKISGEVVDWAVVAEPALSKLANAFDKKKLNYTIINLQEKFYKKYETKWNKHYICQAGLFVNKEFKEKHNSSYKNVMNTYKTSIDNLFNNFESTLKHFSDKYTSQSFTNTFGFSLELLSKVQGENSKKNGFGVVPNGVSFSVEDINNFNSLLK